MSKIIVRLLVCLLVCLLVATGFPPVATAQGAFDLSVTPATAYIRLRPGTSATHVITLENSGTQNITIKPRIVDFKPDSGTVIPQSTLTFPYLEVPSAGFQPLTLQPGQKSQLSVKISPPVEAIEKEWYLSILFESFSDNESLELNSSIVKPSVGSNLIILIAQKDHEEFLKITNFGVAKIIDSFRSLQFNPEIYNPGAQAVVASGSATLSNWKGKVIYSAPFYPDVLVAKDTRKLRASKTIFDENLVQDRQVPVDFIYSPKFLLGLYRLEYLLIDSKGNNQVYSHLVLAFPLTAIFVGLLMGITQLGFYLFKQQQKGK